MASARRRRHAALIDELFEEPQKFGFFQAVRLLERAAEQAGEESARTAVGEFGDPGREVVRFTALSEARFPSSEVARLTPAETDEAGRETSPPKMSVAFLGLTGPTGALPDHYTTTIVRRARTHDVALEAFFDLFNHRIVSLFYRVWEKYRIPVRLERQLQRRSGTDLTDLALLGLIGLGTDGLRGRQQVPDRALLFYAGLFAQKPRNAISLERMLGAYFELPVKVVQFRGEWHRLDIEERSHLPSEAAPLGRHNLLGHDTILGGHVWDVQGQFNVRVGPLSYSLFRAFMPTGDMLRPFSELVRSYVGPQLGFAVQPVLAENEAPPCLIGAYGDDPPLLGWNTWIHAEPIAETFDGVRFSLDEIDLEA